MFYLLASLISENFAKGPELLGIVCDIVVICLLIIMFFDRKEK